MWLKHPTIVAVRHGESHRNSIKRGGAALSEENVRDGAAAVPDWEMQLSPLGEKQAMRLRDRWSDIADAAALDRTASKRFTIFSSGYRRCVQTCDISTRGVELFRPERHVDIRVRERDAGYVYDMRHSELERHYPFAERNRTLMQGDFFFRPPGGESLADVSARLAHFLSDVSDQMPGTDAILLFTHGGAMRALRALLGSMAPSECVKVQNPSNCDAWVWRSGCSEPLEVR